MKKNIVVFTILFLSTICASQAQYRLRKGDKQLNAGIGFSGWGIPLYVGMDFGVHKDISVGGEFSFRSYSNRFDNYNYSHQIFGISANGNYHFNSLLEIPKEWDLYAGLNLGFYFWSSPNAYHGDGSGVGLGIQIGGRYYFDKNWGINLELGGGNAFSGGKFGVSYAF